MIRKLNILFITFLILIFPCILSSEDKEYKWNNVSGKWETGKDEKGPFLFEKNGKCIKWDYSEIINYNSILTMNPANDCSSIKFNIEIVDPATFPVEIMPLFSLKNFRTFYAFKFVVDKKKNSELQFINSKIKDESMDKSVKKNFIINILQSKNYDLKFGRNYNIEIKINKNKADLFIDGKKEMEAQAAENLDSGRIGFSGKNAKLRVRDVKIYSGEKIIFEDDFSGDLIKRIVVRAKRVE